MEVYVWVPLVCFLLWLLFRTREGYVDVPGPGVRPSMEDAAWRSKVDAQIPIGASTEDYMRALQSFFDTVYKPFRTANTTGSVPASSVETFLQAQPATIDKSTLRQIMLSGFAIDRGETGAAREQRQLKTTDALKGFKSEGGSALIEPKNGVDETWPQYTNKSPYTPADTRIGPASEGIYEPIPSSQPKRTGYLDEGSTSWTSGSFYNICMGGKCAKNVL